MASLYSSKNVAYICLEKQNIIIKNSLSYLEDILELPYLPDYDQEVWSHLWSLRFPEMLHTYIMKSKIYINIHVSISYLSDILELPNLPDDDQETWSHIYMASLCPEHSKNMCLVSWKAKNP